LKSGLPLYVWVLIQGDPFFYETGDDPCILSSLFQSPCSVNQTSQSPGPFNFSCNCMMPLLHEFVTPWAHTKSLIRDDSASLNPWLRLSVAMCVSPIAVPRLAIAYASHFAQFPVWRQSSHSYIHAGAKKQQNKHSLGPTLIIL
jgi:hypothetical protein